ncbi:MAG: hypothetical protein EA399_02705 [Desulfovibrionales bacterium]|nr:MAG: hypothetical protein EA399_02705 [Desulfovibrionales bacterium]
MGLDHLLVHDAERSMWLSGTLPVTCLGRTIRLSLSGVGGSEAGPLGKEGSDDIPSPHAAKKSKDYDEDRKPPV